MTSTGIFHILKASQHVITAVQGICVLIYHKLIQIAVLIQCELIIAD